MLDDTRAHLQQYGWTGRGRLNREEVKTLLEQKHLKYFDKIGDFTDQYEGLKFFTRSIEPIMIDTTFMDIFQLQKEPLYRDELNQYISLDLPDILEYFENYESNAPFDVFLGRAFSPVGMWMAVYGHGFLIMDTDGMLYMTTNGSIGAISESDLDFVDRLLTLGELCRIDPDRYFAGFDMKLYKE